MARLPTLPLPLRELLERWAGPALLVAAGATTLFWSWGHWPDILVDFGRELYVPWRLAEGEVLYRDISYLNGPLSPYWNSLWFRIFPVGLRTLALVNIALVALLVALLVRLLTAVSDRFSAHVAAFVFLTLFAFIQLDTIGNYNYVTPYSHEVTHGLLLSLGAILLLSLRARFGDLAVAGSGLGLGLVLLTKVEISIAALGGTLALLILSLAAEPAEQRRSVRTLGIFAGAALVPPLLAWLLLSLAMPPERALAGLVGPWRSSFNEEVTSLEFYRWGMGLHQMDLHLGRLRGWLWRYALVLGPAAALALALRRPGWTRWAATALAAGAVLAFARIEHTVLWTQFTRPLALFVPALGLWAFARFVADWRAGRDARESALRVALCVFAFALLAKIILNIRLYHYGFALAMPGSMLLVVALLCWIPRSIDRLGGYGRLFQAVSAAGIAVGVVIMLQLAQGRFDRRVHWVGEGADVFRAGPRALFVTRLLDEIRQRVAPDETLTVLPEGVMVNYLSRRVNPTSFTNFMPPEVIIFGEEPMLREFRADPPDWIAVIHKRTEEYGFEFFGKDYARALYTWVRHHYRPVVRIGQPPLESETRFGVQLLKRLEARPAPPDAASAPAAQGVR